MQSHQSVLCVCVCVPARMTKEYLFECNKLNVRFQLIIAFGGTAFKQFVYVCCVHGMRAAKYELETAVTVEFKKQNVFVCLFICSFARARVKHKQIMSHASQQ